MCGICGLWQRNTPVDETTLRAMSDRQAHRGPDDWGVYCNADRRLGFGFRRLAIIDLSPSGHQPMSNEDGSLWIVFNGEIYNHPTLRQELVRAGHEFRSTSDTEVILHGYEEWGEGLLQRLRGMFAFTIWNESNQSLFIARDRLGIKPLHYYWDGERFAFASEIKSLLTLPNLKTDLDHSALWDYFTYLYIPTPKTVYKFIRKLPPAHFLKFNGHEPEIKEYWDVKEWGASSLTRPEAAEAVCEKLFETTKAYLIADVPVGVLLSGGLDSTAVTAAATKGRPPESPLQSFSIGFDVLEHSELEFAQIAAETFGTLHRTRIVSQESLAEGLARTITLFDEPFAETSGLPTLAVSELAAKHVKVVLAGDGGDETLAGYFKYWRWLELAAQDRGSPALRKLIFDDVALNLLKPLAGLPKIQAVINLASLDVRGKDGVDRYGAIISPIKTYQKPKLLPDLAREFRGYDDYWHLRRYWRDDLDPLSRLQYVDLKTYLPDDILTKVDRASMAASLEARVPLLDHEWVELTASLPSEFRFRKAIFREALAGILPGPILSRRKKGFSSPMLNWQKVETRNGARLGGAALWAAQVYDTWQTARV
ncbi:MAG: asparagine synthase (glutamine-hydrolyzing) [Chloroflexi bacterium]|nr:asparagine synthase (glutamine-hydrolyzing) [Chloroflexota bacterium]